MKVAFSALLCIFSTVWGLSCDKGWYFSQDANGCKPCQQGRYGATAGLESPVCSGECLPGWHCPQASVSATQQPCGEGFYCPGNLLPRVSISTGFTCASGADSEHCTSQRICNKGHFCVLGTEYGCPAGTFGNSTGLTSPDCTGPCPKGWICPAGSVVPTACTPGHWCADGVNEIDCPAGTFGAGPAFKTVSECAPCEAGYWCETASTDRQQHACEGGLWGEPGSVDSSCSGGCIEGYYCPEASASPRQHSCGSVSMYCPAFSPAPISVPAGYYSIGGDSTHRTSIVQCPPGTFCLGGEKYSCSAGSYSSIDGEISGGCTVCPAGFYCLEEASEATPCPAGRYGLTEGLKTPQCSGQCAYPWCCPAGTVNPVFEDCRNAILPVSDEDRTRDQKREKAELFKAQRSVGSV